MTQTTQELVNEKLAELHEVWKRCNGFPGKGSSSEQTFDTLIQEIMLLMDGDDAA